MKILGIITEHNPFHNGHKYHLAMARRLTGAEGVVSVMSGNFLQRGEPALINKWARAEMALCQGVDVVLELPAAFATRSAPAFARGAVETLNHTGIVTHLCFGSENGDITNLKKLAHILKEEPRELQELIKLELEQGVILPLARERALQKYLQPNEELALLASSPNNILGIEYLKALLQSESSIEPMTIKRLTAGYHDIEIAPKQEIASATGIRNLIFANENYNQVLTELVPPSTFEILQDEISAGRGPIGTDNLSLPLFWNILNAGPAGLANIIDVTEGLENRLYEQALTCASFSQLVEKTKTKRYTWTRLQRILIHFLLGYTKTQASRFDQTGPAYLRVLGFTEKGREILQAIKKEASLPLILHPAPWLKEQDTLAEMLKLDIKASDLYALLYPAAAHRLAGRDYREKPVIVN